MTVTLPAIPRSRRLGGLLERRECWAFTKRARVLLLLTACTTAIAVFYGIHPFLAVRSGGFGEVLVVEGWVSSRSLVDAALTFHQGHYKRVVIVKDVYESKDKWTSGSYAADYISADLAQRGIPKDAIETLFCPVAFKDRTYHCAIAVRECLENRSRGVTRIDVVTVGSHARRSRLLYAKAFGSGVSIGVIPLEDRTYDPGAWWRSSSGVRDVLGETIAYLYVRLFFWP